MDILTRALLIAGVMILGAAGAHGQSAEVEPLSKEWDELGLITGFHSVINKNAGLVLRVLEADGASSVAENPVSLFVVAINQGTSDLQEHVWRLPRGVSKAKKVTASQCGLDIVADVDATDEDQRVIGQTPTVIKTCFIDVTGGLESRLHLSEVSASPGK